jgi:hypothetical protein
MFLVKDTPAQRERRIRQFLASDPPIAVLLAAIHFEWTVKRAILKLSVRPTAQLRGDLAETFGLERYKDAWSAELGLPGMPAVVGRSLWHRVTIAFRLRNQIVHGAGGCSQSHAEPRVNALLDAAERLRALAADRGSDLYTKLQVRRVTRGNSPTKTGRR